MGEERDGRDELQKALDDIRKGVQNVQEELEGIKGLMNRSNISARGVAAAMLLLSTGIAFFVTGIQLGREGKVEATGWIIGAVVALFFGSFIIDWTKTVLKGQKPKAMSTQR